MSIRHNVVVESVGSRTFANQRLALQQQEEAVVNRLIARISSHKDVQKAFEEQGNIPWSFDVDVTEGVVAYIGSKKITVIPPKQLLNEPLFSGLTRSLEKRAERENLGAIEPSFSQEEQEHEEAVQRIFLDTFRKRELEEGIRKDPSKKTTWKDRVSVIKDKATVLVKGSSILSKVMKLSNKVIAFMQSFGSSESVLSNQMSADISKEKKPFPKPFHTVDPTKVQLGVGYAMSGLDVLGSAFSLHDAYKGLSKAHRHENSEGLALSAGSVFTCLGGLLSGSVGIAKTVAQTENAVQMVRSITPMLAPIGFVSNGISIASKIYSLGRTAQFRSEMNQILDQKNVSEEEKCRKFLVWLKHKLTPSNEEIGRIIAKAKQEGKDPEKEIKLALERKWDRFGLRTGQKDAWTIVTALLSNQWLNAFGELKPEAKDQVKKLITAVSRANFLEVGSYVFRIFLILLSVTALILAVVLPTSHATTFFYVFSAVISALEATQELWADKLPNFLHSLAPRVFPCKGVDGFLGRLTWRIRQAVFRRFYSDRIDTVELPCKALKISKIISGSSGGTPPTPSTPTAEMS